MTARTEGNWQGMNWIRQEKRLAIYLRDGCACVWCGSSDVQFTLDHIVCHKKGGSNDQTNLVTACKRCNDSRGARSAKKFSVAIAAYLNHGIKAADILAHVQRCRFRVLNIEEAKELIAQRGSVFNVLKRGVR